MDSIVDVMSPPNRKIGRDQVEDCSSRNGMAADKIERFLRPNSGYDS